MAHICLCYHCVSFIFFKNRWIQFLIYYNSSLDKLPLRTWYVLHVTLNSRLILFHNPRLLYSSMISANLSWLVNQIFTLWFIPIQHICNSVLHVFVLWNILNTFTNPYTFRWTPIFSWKGFKLFRLAYFLFYQGSPNLWFQSCQKCHCFSLIALMFLILHTTHQK